MKVEFTFGEPHGYSDHRSVQTRQGSEIQWNIPHAELPLLCNGVKVGYVEVHMHAAWAPDGVPDTSFGFTGRINTEELRAALAKAGAA